MTSRGEVLQELAKLEQVHFEIAQVSSRTDSERARDLIRLRRTLSEQIGRVGTIVGGYFEATEKPELVQQFRNHFSAMRTRTATHQANWPAVRLDEAGDEYQSSARAVREANKAFVSWVKSALA